MLLKKKKYFYFYKFAGDYSFVFTAIENNTGYFKKAKCIDVLQLTALTMTSQN